MLALLLCTGHRAYALPRCIMYAYVTYIDLFCSCPLRFAASLFCHYYSVQSVVLPMGMF